MKLSSLKPKKSLQIIIFIKIEESIDHQIITVLQEKSHAAPNPNEAGHGSWMRVKSQRSKLPGICSVFTITGQVILFNHLHVYSP